MTDLTPTLSHILTTTHKLSPIAPPSFQTLDSFLIEARQIHTSIRELLSYLRALRSPYLSTTPPPKRRIQTHDSLKPANQIGNDTIRTSLGDIPIHLTTPQREAIDTQTSTLLRTVNTQITNLARATNLNHQTALQRITKLYGASKRNFLQKWAGGDLDGPEKDAKEVQRVSEEGRENTLFTVRESILWYLNNLLKRAVEAQQEMIEIRLEREREKRASILYDEQNRNVKLQTSHEGDGEREGYNLAYNPALDKKESQADLEAMGLTTEQIQMFEQENNSLVEKYTDQLAQVTQAEKSLIEISELQSTLVGHLSVQSEQIGMLVEDADRTDENVKKGNEQLKKATERTSTARLVYHATLWICGSLIVWDLIF